MILHNVSRHYSRTKTRLFTFFIQMIDLIKLSKHLLSNCFNPNLNLFAVLSRSAPSSQYSFHSDREFCEARFHRSGQSY